ncbi:glycosyltransferase family 2 protein [Cytobacillus sp. NJ13]|nr:glycosyltransferase family 2 protein [Cytobacillus sp. NJ13]
MLESGRTERKIFSVSMVKNEADIIESFVRYHQHIFDGMVFLDNMSSDRTPEILEKLKEEGLPIFISYDTDHEFAQGKKTTQLMLNTFEQFQPDIILPLDADEFLVSNDHLEHPCDVLNKIDLNQLHHIAWRTYVLNEYDNRNELFIPKRITYARADYHETNHKVVVTANFAKKYPGTLSEGNHKYRINRGKKKVKKNFLKELKIAHFPIRSLEQFKSKLLVTWINRLSRQKIENLYFLERFVQIIKDSRSRTEEDLIQLVRDYHCETELKDITLVHKPLDLSFCKPLKLKYTKENEVDALLNLLENCEEMAKEFFKLKREY